MITNVAQLIEAFLRKQASLLDAEALKHAPTIGSMYEGLSKEALEMAVPVGAGLRIVDGFIEGHDGELSPQMDVMLVVGHGGRKIPFTDHYRWPIADVLAVIEVKKNLFGGELVDAIAKSVAIAKMQVAAFAADAVADHSISTSNRAFARLRGRFPDRDLLDDLERDDGEVLRGLVLEQFAPVRIVLGFQGYADETSLRKGLLDQLEAQLDQGWSPVGLPNLIVCRSNAILKLNGHPYISPSDDEWWPLLASERNAPFRLMIELIWTRLANRFEAVLPMDDTLVEEQLARLLAARSVRHEGRRGWEYTSHEPDLRKWDAGQPTEWAPLPVTAAEDFLVRTVMAEGGVDATDPKLRSFCRARGWDIHASIESLIARRILVREFDGRLMPVTDAGVVTMTPDGGRWWSTNDELLALWLAKRERSKL
ncbi:hypothetical protein N0B44_28885 [Roseibacterium beibuensis]|nr:DUF6602 domain-containing protein [Roseibacterium beibuensis]MCS6626940.1 hypothetical protein [Roseibacterium beibuensis]